AFKGQPVKGDTVFPRRNDMKSQHQGQYWIGTFEIDGDKPQGTLTSAPFKVTHPWCSFLVGGGPHPETCVELILKETGEVFSRTTARERETRDRARGHLTKFWGKEIALRRFEKPSAPGAHINFNAYPFPPKNPNFPKRKAPNTHPPLDTFKYAGLDPQKA